MWKTTQTFKQKNTPFNGIDVNKFVQKKTNTTESKRAKTIFENKQTRKKNKTPNSKKPPECGPRLESAVEKTPSFPTPITRVKRG